MRATLADLNDHGGKAAGFWSKSSASDSSNSSDSGSNSDVSVSSNYGNGEWRQRKKVGKTDKGCVGDVNGDGGEEVDKE